MATRGLFVFLVLLLIMQVWAESTHARINDAQHTELQTNGDENSNGGVKSQIGIVCVKECRKRCYKASEHHHCLKHCEICCKQCHCVPPGLGKEDTCPCYADLKNAEGKYKCP